MNIGIENIKRYLRISHNLDDDYLKELAELSKKYIKEQTGVAYKETDEVYNMAVLQSVSHFYDNRSPLSEKAMLHVPYTLEALIKHIGARGASDE